MAATIPLNPGGDASVGVLFRKIDPMLKEGESTKFSMKRSLALRIFDNESTSDTLLHLRLPEMLYRVECVVFAAAFGLSLFYTLSMPTASNPKMAYGISLVATISGIVAFVAYQTSAQLKQFRIVNTSEDALLESDVGKNLKKEGNNELLNERKRYISSGTFMNYDIDVLAETGKYDANFQAARGSGGAFKKARLEVNIDLMRYAATMTAGPLVVFLLFNMISDQYGEIFKSRAATALCVILGSLFITFAKLVSMDFQVPLDLYASILNLALILFSGVAFILAWLDIFLAAVDESLEVHVFFYLFLSMPLYMLTYIYVMVTRIREDGFAKDKIGLNKESKYNTVVDTESTMTFKRNLDKVTRDLNLDTTKHLLVVAIDILTLGFLCYGFIFYAFGMPFSDKPFVLPLESYTLSPSPPPPLPSSP